MRLPELTGYQYEELLGEDPFGWSFVARYKGSERRVLKVLKGQATNEDFLARYLQIFSSEENSIQGAARVFDYTAPDLDTPAVYAMPFYGWRGRETEKWQLTSLKRLMHLFEGDQAVDIVREVARGIASPHYQGVYHGGLNPSNIFITGDSSGNREIQIGDFGQVFMGDLQYLAAGDLLFYVSPEQLENGDFSGNLGFQSDVYSFGVIAFQILTGHLPRLDRLRQQCLERPGALSSVPAIAFGELSAVSEHFLKQLKAEIPVEWPEAASDERSEQLREVVQRCLEFEPGSRTASMREVVESIEQIFEQVEQPAVAAEPAATYVAEEEILSEAVSEALPEEMSEVFSEIEEGEIHGEQALIGEEFAPSGPAPRQERGDVSSARFRVAEFFAHRPVLIWQLAAVFAMLALLPLSFFTISYYWKYRETRNELTVEAAQLQANVEKQAEAYQKVMTEKQKSSESLKSELNEVEDSRSRLLGEAKLARQILRQTQENGDEIFRLVLENKDTDVPNFREERVKALENARDHYERLIEVYGDAPDFIVSTANAFFYLGRIYREMGEFGKSLASFGEAERRYMALLDEAESPEVSFVRNLAIAKFSLGQLSIKNSKFAIARHFFTESSRYWAETRAISPPDALSAAISIHENSLWIAECELSINRLEAALDGAHSIGAQLLKLQEHDAENDRIIGALAKSFELVGRVFEAQGDGEGAAEAYKQSGNLFAQAVKLNAAIDAYRLGLGNSLAREGLLKNDIKKMEGAVEVLSQVVVNNAYESAFQKTLADVYGVLSQNQRDGGHAENAILLEQEAISILQPIIRENPAAVPPDVLYSYSQRLAHLAELLGDAGEFDESRPPLQESINVLERISRSEGATASYHRALARARGLAGFACLKSGDKSEAKEHLELAKAEWENYMAENPEDSDAEQAVRWTTDQLRGLQ